MTGRGKGQLTLLGGFETFSDMSFKEHSS
jgi:hypothetical protein